MEQHLTQLGYRVETASSTKEACLPAANGGSEPVVPTHLLEEAQVAQAPRLIVELLLLRILCDAHKDVGGRVIEEPEQRVFAGLLPQVSLYAF